jgi:hypothetical protein
MPANMAGGRRRRVEEQHPIPDHTVQAGGVIPPVLEFEGF